MWYTNHLPSHMTSTEVHAMYQTPAISTGVHAMCQTPEAEAATNGTTAECKRVA